MYPEYFPNGTLAADWDVVNEIAETLTKMGIETSFHHVKGHQDDKVAYENLTLEARLNVDADAEASECRYHHPEPRPKVPRLPTKAAQLHIRGITISGHYHAEIECAVSTPQLRQYIQAKNNWLDDQMKAINWVAHGKALSCMSQRHIQLTKMCHEILSTANITHRYDPKSSPLCSYCKTGEEDRDHVLRCSHSAKTIWRKHAILAQQKRCKEMHTREMLITILTDGIQAWFNDTPMQPENYPPTFHKLIKDQTAIGWRQLFHGRFATEWQRLQNQHLRQNGIKKITLTGQSWTISMIVQLWREFFDLWDQ
jgi:hypothetical protein